MWWNKRPDELKLVDITELEALIESARLDGTQKEYLRKRWLHQIRWWDKRAWEARQRYFRLRATIVLGGTIAPFLMTASFGYSVDPWTQRVGAIVSLLVAACAALEALYGWGAIWLEKRRAAELLKVEGWLLLHGAGRYKDLLETARFPEFVTEVESQIAGEVGAYIAVAQSAQTRPNSGQPPQDGTETPKK